MHAQLRHLASMYTVGAYTVCGYSAYSYVVMYAGLCESHGSMNHVTLNKSTFDPL